MISLPILTGFIYIPSTRPAVRANSLTVSKILTSVISNSEKVSAVTMVVVERPMSRVDDDLDLLVICVKVTADATISSLLYTNSPSSSDQDISTFDHLLTDIIFVDAYHALVSLVTM